MEPVNRKVTYRLYPTAKQETALLAIKRGHQHLYNIATADGVQSPIANPRVLGQSEAALKAAYRARDHKRQDSRRCWLWPYNNWSQELTPRHTAQNLPLEPVA
jgi:hypothetical protein